VEIRPASDRSLLVSFGHEISVEAHREVLQLTHILRHWPAWLTNYHPAYASVLIEFDPLDHTHAEISTIISGQISGVEFAPQLGTRTIEIPVRYGGDFGPDLQDVAAHAGLSPDGVVELHAAATYRVYFLGFSPGFPYLGGLPAELATPRLAAPRLRVPAGSVAIGGSQAGIYPLESPGGWRIIGRTEARLFDEDATPPALLTGGDTVRFVPQRGR
jgi:inhibitor of KinA